MGQNSHITNGQSGALYINDTNPHVIDSVKHPGGVVVLYPLADTVLSSASVGNVEGLAGSGDTLPAGVPIYGSWSTIQLVSGRLVGYYRN